MRTGAPGRTGYPTLPTERGQAPAAVPAGTPLPRIVPAPARVAVAFVRSASRAGAAYVLQPHAWLLRVLRSLATAAVTSGGVTKQLSGLPNSRQAGGSWTSCGSRLSKSESPMGTSSEMLVRFGRRSGQAKESTGELNSPIPAWGLFLAPMGERWWCQVRVLSSPGETDSTKSKAAPWASLSSV